MRKINWESIGNTVGTVCEIATYGIMLVVSYKLVEEAAKPYVAESVGYDDAVSAIMDSGMFSNDKAGAVTALKKYASKEYYKSVISIVESGMFSNEKLDTIRNISE